jgi:PHD/YefM family antitoxin component YafN of YafNO toxin-antitoxin module
MIILPSADIRQNYTEVSRKAKESGEAIFITVNGSGDGVFMSTEAYEQQTKMLELKEKLLDIAIARANGKKDIPATEFTSHFAKLASKYRNESK